MNDLIRQAITAEADERVDSRTVLANLHKAKKRKPLGLIVGVATLTAAAAAAAVVIPMTIKKTKAVSPAVSVTAQETQNVLLIGLDDVDNTDALMLARFKGDGAAVSVVSLPRDVFVDGLKINSLFKQAPEKLTQAVEKTTGVKVDHHAAVKMSDFGKISQLVGGVEVCLKAASRDQITGASFPAGRQVLEGEKALTFLRQRVGLPQGDLDRAKRQQAFLVGLASQITRDKALALARGVDGMIEVDSGWDVLGFAQRFSGPLAISVSTLPVSETVGKGNVLGFEADPAKSKEFVDKALEGRDNSGGDSCVH